MTVTNTAIPVVSGTARVGQMLQTTDGSWTFDENYLTYAYQWLRCDAMGLNCADITGETANAYVITNADIGSTLRSEVTATEHAAPSGNFFISPTGSDTTGDGSIGNPWKTLQKLYNNVGPGQTGYVRGGTYPNTLHVSGDAPYIINGAGVGGGSSGSPILISAYPSETPVINGPWHSISPSWITFYGLTLNPTPSNNAADMPVWIGGGTNVTFENCDVVGYPRGSAFFLGSSPNFTLKHSRIHGITWSGTGNQPHGIYVHDSTGLVIENNKFYDITEYNTFGVQLYPGTNTGAIIRNNIFDSLNSAIVMYGTNASPQIYDNIFSNGGSSGNAMIHTDGNVTGASIHDNHYYNTPSGKTDGGIASSAWTTGNPLYTDQAGRQYYPLGAGSPAAGKGTDW